MFVKNIIYNEDCLIGMDRIPDKSVDMILCDLPYGNTNHGWDVIIPFVPLWQQYLRVVKENAAIVLTSQQPFATDLINSCRKYFRYEIIWQKTQKLGFANAKKMPLRGHENVLIFYKKLPVYNPQFTQEQATHGRVRKKTTLHQGKKYEGYGGGFDDNYEYTDTGRRYPTSVIQFSNWNGALFGNTSQAGTHPTQKPVSLFRWLIRTYTNPGALVLDNCMGGGTTAIACMDEGRDYIGFEMSKKYYQKAIKRIELHGQQQKLFI